MRKIKEVLRLRSAGLSTRQIAASIGAPSSTVADYLKRAGAAGLAWPLPDKTDENDLERQLFPAMHSSKASSKKPDYGYIHNELKKKNVTMTLLWTEHLSDNPGGYRYTQ